VAGAVFVENGTDFVAPRDVNDILYVLRIDHEYNFVVQSSIGIVLCSTE